MVSTSVLFISLALPDPPFTAVRSFLLLSGYARDPTVFSYGIYKESGM